MVIYKYKIDKHGVNEVEMPINAKVLCVKEQRDGLVLWALVEDESNESMFRCSNETTRARFFVNVFTGEEFKSAVILLYISTTQMKSGIVVHTFEAEKNIAKENMW